MGFEVSSYEIQKLAAEFIQDPTHWGYAALLIAGMRILNFSVFASLFISIVAVSIGLEGFETSTSRYVFGETIVPRLIVMVPISSSFCFIAYFMFPSKQPISKPNQPKNSIAEQMANAKLEAQWRPL